MVALAAAFGALAGAGAFFLWPFDVGGVWGIWAAGAGLLGCGVVQTRGGWAASVMFGLGGAAFALAAWQTDRQVVLDYAGAHKPHWIVGQIAEMRVKDETPNRVTLRLVEVETYGLGDAPVSGASIGVYKNQVRDVAIGDSVALPVVLMAPEGPKFKGQRDARLWQYFNENRIGGYVMGTVEPTYRVVPQKGWLPELAARIEGLRNRIAEVTRPLADGAVSALLVGDEKGIPPELRNAYRVTGLSHLLAISGMQVTLVVLCIYGTLRWLGALVPWVALRVNIRLGAALVALGGTVFYTLLAGASVSLVRASLMAGIVMLAVITGRMNHALRAWCVAVVLIVLASPVMVTRAGFLLSIVAVLGLLLLMMAEKGIWKGGKARTWLRELVLATVVAGAATAPVLVALFGQFSMVSMAANLVAVPIMALATYAGMLALLLWPLGLEQPMLQLMALPVGWVNDLALWLSGFGFSSMAVDPRLWWVVAVFALVVIGSVFLKRWVEAAAGLAAMCGIVAVVATTQLKPELMIWNDGKVGIGRIGPEYRLLWAENRSDAAWMAKAAGIALTVGDDVPQTVDDRYMPVTEYEHFAWAERVNGRWHVEPVACGRIWQRMAEGCWK